LNESFGSPESQTTLDTLNPGAGGLTEEYFPSFIYDDRGRKDPFAPAIKDPEPVVTSDAPSAEPTQEEKVREGLSKFEVSALTVTAILVGKNKPKALVKDPTGVVYMIQENDRVGRNNGIVRRIRQGQIVIVESREQKDGERLYTTQVLSLGK
jgi:Tfp pilus assembly protein PilP